MDSLKENEIQNRLTEIGECVAAICNLLPDVQPAPNLSKTAYGALALHECCEEIKESLRLATENFTRFLGGSL